MKTVKFEMQIASGNQAVMDDPELEVGRILGVVRQRIEDGEEDGYLRDYNGNKVGTFCLEIEDDDEE